MARGGNVGQGGDGALHRLIEALAAWRTVVRVVERSADVVPPVCKIPVREHPLAEPVIEPNRQASRDREGPNCRLRPLVGAGVDGVWRQVMESGAERFRGLGAGFAQRHIRVRPNRLAMADQEQLRHGGQKNESIAGRRTRPEDALRSESNPVAGITPPAWQSRLSNTAAILWVAVFASWRCCRWTQRGKGRSVPLPPSRCSRAPAELPQIGSGFR